jgi:flavin-dependent dehydrogenase
MKQVDLVIAGAGFAGLACATAAARRGLEVVVLEKKSDIGRGVHTTGILVKEAARLLDVPDRLIRRITDIRLYAPSLDFIDLAARDYFFLATDTPGLMRHMADRAAADGVDIRWGTPFAGATQADGEIVLETQDLASRFLIGADGAASKVAACFGLGTPRRHLVGVEAEFRATGLDDNAFHCFLDQARAFGYIGWAVPGVDVTQVGLAACQPAKPDLDGFIARIAPLFDLDRAQRVGRRGGLIPISGIVRPLAKGRVMLLGDSAGMVSPFSAGGIHLCLHYGEMAGEAVADYLAGRRVHPAGQMAKASPGFAVKRTLRWCFENLAPDWLLNRVIASAPFKWLARAVFFREKRLP